MPQGSGRPGQARDSAAICHHLEPLWGAGLARGQRVVAAAWPVSSSYSYKRRARSGKLEAEWVGQKPASVARKRALAVTKNPEIKGRVR